VLLVHGEKAKMFVDENILIFRIRVFLVFVQSLRFDCILDRR